MKKNLRIVSAAAAALLAVAPVAAGAVSTVSADSVTSSANSNATAVKNIEAGITVRNNGTVDNGHSASELQTKIWSTTGKINIEGKSIKIVRARLHSNGAVSDRAEDYANDAALSHVETGVQYVAVIDGITINGLNKNGSYTLNGHNIVVTNNGDTVPFGLVSRAFYIGKTTGAPSIREIASGKEVKSGEVGLGNGNYNVSSIVDAIQAKYRLETSVSGSAFSEWDDIYTNVRDGLKAAGITVNADDTFAKPSAPFTVNVMLHSSNNIDVTFPVTVNPDPLTDGDVTFPQIHFGGVNTPAYRGTHNTIDVGNAGFNYMTPGQGVDVGGIKNAFTITVSATNHTRIDPQVDYSKVNTAVAGKYPVTVSATNSDGKTSSVTFFLTVGAKGATYTKVQADIDNVPVYDISGNTVTDTKTTVKNGDQIATYGTVTVGDKSYTRINSANSTKFVETKYVDGSVKPVAAVAKKVMHNSYIYDQNHKRIGTNVLAAYSTVNVYGPTTKLADGSLVYKIGDNQYVMADNIDGTARVLSHNAYVYKTSKKRADRRVLRKGSTVVTFGSPYTFKNGKAYYRIGGPAKQYVKVANFK